MNPATALTLVSTVIGISKDIYLVGKWVHKTALSMHNHDNERDELTEEFRAEFNKLNSFTRLFETSRQGIKGEEDLVWLGTMSKVCEGLSQDFAEYTRLAAQSDPEYQAKFLDDSPEDTTKSDEQRDDLTKPGWSWRVGPLRKKPHAHKNQLRARTQWALFERERFEGLVKKFAARNGELQDVLQIAILAQLQRQAVNASNNESFTRLIQNQDAKRLGLSQHVEIRRLIQGEKKSQLSPALYLHDTTVVSESDMPMLHQGEIETVQARGNIPKQKVLIEYKYYDASAELSESQVLQRRDTDSISSIPPTVAQLANLLATSGANRLGTLPFKGILNQPEKSRFAFIFEFPPKTQSTHPSSLHDLIKQASENRNSAFELGLRFQMAQFLAKTIRMLHVDRWIHKNLTSHSLVLFNDRQEKKPLFTEMYLVDFEYSRLDSGSTLRLVDTDPERNLYRRPEIQHENRPAFTRIDDLYSLGVVLLEIAVWQTARQIVDDNILDSDARRVPDNIRQVYVAVAKQRVPARMGERFQRAVLACLTGEFEDQCHSPEFPQIFQEEIILSLAAAFGKP